MNNRFIPERHPGQAFAGGRLAVGSALGAERNPQGDMKAEAMISVLLITHRPPLPPRRILSRGTDHDKEGEADPFGGGGS